MALSSRNPPSSHWILTSCITFKAISSEFFPKAYPAAPQPKTSFSFAFWERDIWPAKKPIVLLDRDFGSTMNVFVAAHKDSGRLDERAAKDLARINALLLMNWEGQHPSPR